MAKARNTKTTTTDNNKSKADHIREWFDANTDGTATECQKALAAKKITVSSGQCQQILTKRKGGGKVDVNSIKVAAEFVKGHGDIEAALTAIDDVGEFIETCGSPKKARAALEAYQSVAEVVG